MESNSDQSLLVFHAAATLLICTVQRITAPKLCTFRKSIIVHHCETVFLVVLVSIKPTSSFVRYVLITDHRELKSAGVDPKWHDGHIKCHPNPSSGSRVGSNGRTDRVSSVSVHFVHIMQETHKKKF
jgi:hypothetical protein